MAHNASAPRAIRRVIDVVARLPGVRPAAAHVRRLVAALRAGGRVDVVGPVDLAREASDHHLCLVVKVDAEDGQNHPPLEVVGVGVVAATQAAAMVIIVTGHMRAGVRKRTCLRQASG